MTQPRSIHVETLLQQLGLSQEDAQYYLSALNAPIILDSDYTVRTLSSNIGAKPIIRLRELGLVGIAPDDTGHLVVRPLDPRLASRALYSRHLWALCPAWIPVESLPSEDRTRISQLYDMCAALESALGALYRPVEQTSAIEMVQQDMISQALAGCIQRAEHDIRGITVPSWAPDIAPIWEAIKERISVGVRYRRLADEITFASFGYWINRRDVEEIGIQLRVLPADSLREKFFVLDATTAFVFWRPGPLFSLEATKTTLDVLVKHCIESFDTLWERAIPAERLFPEVKRLRDNYVGRARSFNDSETLSFIAEGFFDYGKFFITPDRKASIVRWARELELLRAKGLTAACPGEPDTEIPNITEELRIIMTQLLNNA